MHTSAADTLWQMLCCTAPPSHRASRVAMSAPAALTADAPACALPRNLQMPWASRPCARALRRCCPCWFSFWIVCRLAECELPEDSCEAPEPKLQAECHVPQPYVSIRTPAALDFSTEMDYIIVIGCPFCSSMSCTASGSCMRCALVDALQLKAYKCCLVAMYDSGSPFISILPFAL